MRDYINEFDVLHSYDYFCKIFPFIFVSFRNHLIVRFGYNKKAKEILKKRRILRRILIDSSYSF